ncbi:MAG: hypothetical protein R3B13_16490 [Polyangiaceae bacterium]
MSIDLSDGTLARVQLLFPGEHQATAIEMIRERCAGNLRIGCKATPESLERIRFAVLKVSCGVLEQLDGAIRLAGLDWRDLLMEAEFAEDPDGHREWWPSSSHASSLERSSR